MPWPLSLRRPGPGRAAVCCRSARIWRQGRRPSARTSLRAQYGDGRIPPEIQAEIDAVFATRSDAAHAVAGGTVTGDTRLRDDRRRAADATQRAEINAQRIPGSGVDTTFETAAADLVGMSFDEYAETSLTTGQQLSSLYSAIMYLRHFDGEKHLIFVNEAGLFLPRLEDDQSLAAMASGARLAEPDGDGSDHAAGPAKSRVA